MPQKLFKTTHNSPEIDTLEKYLNATDSPAFQYVNNYHQFLNVIGEDGLTNLQRILHTFTPHEKARLVKQHILSQFTDNIYSCESIQLPIKTGTLFYLEWEKVNTISFLTEGVEVVSTDEPAFKAAQLARLESDLNYTSVNEGTDTKDIFPDCTVWIWCRALSSKQDGDGELQGQFFDLTPFIQKLTTNMGKMGGNFQITLPPLVCELDSDQKWVLRKSDMVQMEDEYLSEGSLFEQDGNVLRRSQLLFHNMMCPNDLIFIRFETLTLEKEQRYKDQQLYFIDKNNLPNRIYDMIGLVDAAMPTINAPTNDVSIQLHGRDLSKLFLEDGTYFYALENSQGIVRVAGSTSLKNSLQNRFAQEKGMHFIGLFNFNSVEKVLKYVIQQLSNIKIIPNNLLSAYGDRRSERYNEQESIEPNTQAERDGLRKKAISEISKIRQKYGATNKSGQDEDVFREAHRFFRQIRDKNLRVLSGSKTSSWKGFIYEGEQLYGGEWPSYFVRELFNIKTNSTVDVAEDTYALIDTIDKIIDLENSQRVIRFEKEKSNGIWQIVKLVIDKSVSKRRLADTSFSTAQGALMNFINTACQEPLVQCYMDTYGDMYHLIVRKPPYDQKALVSLLEGRIATEETGDDILPAVINIEGDDVIQEALSRDDSQVYSWYHFFPQGAMINTSVDYSTTILPAIFFDEYAQVFGSKAFQQSHAYIPYVPRDFSSEFGNKLYEQAFSDLKYVVECNQYLPFTRKGTIVLNGDRRIKIGNPIRYKPTGEIFFVESVNNNLQISDNNIDRTTTIQVSRGMVEQFIYGKHMQDADGKQVYVSYFNIIDTRLNKDTYRQVTKKVTEQKPVMKTVVSGRYRNGFPQYIAHQQGLGGARMIAQAYKRGFQKVRSREIWRNMWEHNPPANSQGVERNVKNWVDLWINDYNKSYDEANNRKSIHEDLFKGTLADIPDTSKKMPLDVMKTFVWRESRDRENAVSRTGCVGFMQVTQRLSNSYKMDRYNPKDNLLMGVKYFADNSSIESDFIGIGDEERQVQVMEPVEKEVTETVVDYDSVFKNFKVNRYTFNFFLKNLQFNPDHMKVTNRQVFNSDQQGTLPDVKPNPV